MLFLVLLVCASMLVTGYIAGKSPQATSQRDSGDTLLARDMAARLAEIQDMRRSVDLHMNALALRLGQMQAQMVRLNALGQRLTQMADLDDGEFNFDEIPALGGSADPLQLGFSSAPAFLHELGQLSRELEDRERQLTVIETLLMNRNVNEQVFPAGRPLLSGWISSFFGVRTNPFNGRREFHRGIDIAGKKGSEVIAVAAGVVTRSERRAGFGNLVEVDHGNGYVTRYAHNDRNLVKVGETVVKGEPVALLGSTGRATGTHVHFEVHRNGKVVDPMRYIKAGS